MTPEQFLEILKASNEQIHESVTTAIDKKVNGHIRALDKKIDDYIAIDIAWKEKDKEWKNQSQPAITLGSKVITFWDVVKWFLITGAIIGGFFAAVNAIKSFFR